MLNLFNYKFSLNPFIRNLASNLCDYSGVNIVKREIPVIVSIMSFEEHFKALELSLYSLLTQSVQPDRIILWLSNEYELSELPYYITRYIKNGLEIRFVEDIGEYNKIIYALKEYSNSIVVTAEDDIIYPKDWLKKLYHSYITNPQDIHLHRAMEVKLYNNNLTSIKNWTTYVKEEMSEYSNFIVSEGGVLYPPNCFSKEVFREDIYRKNAPVNPDIWLWFMALVSKRKIRVVKSHIKNLTCINFLNKILEINSDKYIQRSDEQIQNLMEFYKQNIMQKLKW